MITLNLTPERVEALRYVIDAGRLEVHYATSAHHYLANVGLLRKTTNLFRDPRYGKVPTEVYIPTPKGRAAAAAEVT